MDERDGPTDLRFEEGMALLEGLVARLESGEASEGLFGATGEFVRTPKWGSLPAADTGRQVRRVALEPGWVESAGGLGCVALSALAWHLARAEAMPFLLALAAGSLWVGLAMAGRVRAS